MVQESLKMALGNPDDPQEMGLGRYLADKAVELIRPDTVSVITGDEPVVWTADGVTAAPYAQARIVWVPLAPRLILQFRERGFDAGLPTTPDALCTRVNSLVMAQAERWLVHHPEDVPVLD